LAEEYIKQHIEKQTSCMSKNNHPVQCTKEMKLKPRFIKLKDKRYTHLCRWGTCTCILHRNWKSIINCQQKTPTSTLSFEVNKLNYN